MYRSQLILNNSEGGVLGSKGFGTSQKRGEGNYSIMSFAYSRRSVVLGRGDDSSSWRDEGYQFTRFYLDRAEEVVVGLFEL